MRRYITAGACSIFLLSGCVFLPIPHDRRVTPLYYGRVTDADTGAPIGGVAVTVTALWADPKTGDTVQATATTDELGEYEVAITERASWFYIFFGPIEGICGGKVNLAHPDYEPKEFKTSVFDGAPIDGVCTGKKHQRNVQLKRAASNQRLEKDVRLRSQSSWTVASQPYR